jgi:hypothetical protein
MVIAIAIAGLVIVGYLVLEATGTSAASSGSAHAISLAIGVAEGGYDGNGTNLNNGTLPSRNHNPGDLTVDVNSTGTGTNGGFIVYPDDATGYAALDYQVNEWINGSSANANSSSSISDISQFYTTDVPAGAQANWAATVAATLGVTADTTLSTIINGAAPMTPAAADSTQVADNNDFGADDGDQDDGGGQDA